MSETEVQSALDLGDRLWLLLSPNPVLTCPSPLTQEVAVPTY